MVAPDIDLLSAVRTHASQRPTAIAVTAQDRTLTYGELVGLVDALAGRLAELDVPAGSPVAVLAGREVELPAAILAAVLAGHMAVPFDAGHPGPSQYQPAVGLDVRAVIAATEGHLTPSVDGLPTLLLDRPAMPAEPRPAGPPRAGAPFAVLHTAGTTGAPAPVVLDRGAVGAVLHDLAAALGLGPTDRAVAWTPVSLGSALIELFVPLVAGAELLLIDEGRLGDVAAIAALLERWRPTFLQATPTCWTLLLAAGWRGGPELTGLASGEPLSARLADRLGRHTRELWSAYGTTETTVCCGLRRAGAEDGGVSPVGRPVGGAVFHVFDDDQRTTPAGELSVSGPVVAAGYLGDAALTARRFITLSTGEMLFRTGDRVHLQPDGELRFVGRAQESATGYFGATDVERSLLDLPGVALCRARMDGEQRLVVEVVVEPDPHDADAVLASVEASVAGYGLPVTVTARSHLPVTAAGRLDRALAEVPAPGEGRRPQTHEERVVADIWADLLGVPDPPVDVSFFELGGYSLAVIRLAARLQEAFELPVPVADLFDHVTITAQAQLVEQIYEEQLASLSE